MPSAPDGAAHPDETECGWRIRELNLAGPVDSDRLTNLSREMMREAIAPGFSGAVFAEAMGIAVAVEIARLDGWREVAS